MWRSELLFLLFIVWDFLDGVSASDFILKQGIDTGSKIIPKHMFRFKGLWWSKYSFFQHSSFQEFKKLEVSNEKGQNPY